MKLLDTLWISDTDPPIGIVLTENEVGQKKVYVKAVQGLNEEYDKQDVAQNGGKIHQRQALKILNHLQSTEIR